MKSNSIERSRKRHNNDLQERLNRRTFQQVVTRTNGKRLIKRPLVKPIYGTVDKLEMVAYGKNKKPLLLTRIQRFRKEVITARMIPLAKNPNKIEIYKSSVSRLNVFTYIGNNTYIYIANHGSFVNIPREEVKPMCEAILCFLEKDSQ